MHEREASDDDVDDDSTIAHTHMPHASFDRCLSLLSHLQLQLLSLALLLVCTSPLVHAADWWVLNSSPCSANCNGFSTRTVKCLDHVGAPVSDESCIAQHGVNSKPKEKVTCNFCPFTIEYSQWSDCTKPCALPLAPNGGTRERTAQCIAWTDLGTSYATAEVGDRANKNNFAVELNACITNGLEVMSLTSSCNGHKCQPYQYFSVPTEVKCNKRCGNGNGYKRKHQCVDAQGVLVADSFCSNLPNFNPNVVAEPCPGDFACATHLELGPWGETGCSKTCGGGFQARKVACQVFNSGPETFTTYTAVVDLAHPTTPNSAYTWYDSAGNSVTLPGGTCTISTLFHDLIVSECNKDVCTIGVEWKCTAYKANRLTQKNERSCVCNDRMTQKTLADSVCINNPEAGEKPTTSTANNDVYLQQTLWSPCSWECQIAGEPKPTQTATYKCAKHDGSNAYIGNADSAPSLCYLGPAYALSNFPVQISRECNSFPCTNTQWAITSSPPCPAACENSLSITRTVECVDMGTLKPVSNSARCKASAKPAETIVCNPQQCKYSWRVMDITEHNGGWTPCSKTCLEPEFYNAAGQPQYEKAGFQTRTVECRNEKNQLSSNPSVDCPTPKPRERQTCNVIPCATTAFITTPNPCGKCWTDANNNFKQTMQCVDPRGKIIPSPAADGSVAPAACAMALALQGITWQAPFANTCTNLGIPKCRPQWQAAPWGPCTQRCTPKRFGGGVAKAADGTVSHPEPGSFGTQTRDPIKCIRADGTEAASVTECADLPPPGDELLRTVQFCNTQFCDYDYNWEPRPVGSPVTASRCLDQFNHYVDPSICRKNAANIGQDAPEAASATPEPYSYAFGVPLYGACSKKCGGGSRTRTPTCARRSDGNTLTGAAATIACGPAPTNPTITSETCNTHPCFYQLQYTPKTKCTKQCGGGTNDVLVQCVPVSSPTFALPDFSACLALGLTLPGNLDLLANTQDVMHADGTIDTSRRLLVGAPCNSQACAGTDKDASTYYAYVKGRWGACSCPITNSYQERSVRCMRLPKNGQTPAPVLEATCARISAANNAVQCVGTTENGNTNPCNNALPMPNPWRVCDDPNMCDDP